MATSVGKILISPHNNRSKDKHRAEVITQHMSKVVQESQVISQHKWNFSWEQGNEISEDEIKIQKDYR